MSAPKYWHLLGDLIARHGMGRRYLLRAAERLPDVHLTQKQATTLIHYVREHGGPSQRFNIGRKASKIWGQVEEDLTQIVESLRSDPPQSPSPHPATGPTDTPPSSPEDGESWEAPAISRAKEGRYLYDAEAQRYTTMVHSGTVHTTLAQHKFILRSYSRWGADKSRMELCRLLGWGWADVLSYLKAHRAYKSTIPLSAEEVAAAETEEDLEELARSVVAQRYGKIEARAERQRLKALEAEALKWRAHIKHTIPIIQKSLEGHIYQQPQPILTIPIASRPWTLLLCLSDVHFGARSTLLETGDYTNSIQQARQRLRHCVELLVAWITRHGRPERIILPLGSDFAHVDGIGPRPETKRGTPQHVDGTPGEILRASIDVMRATAETLGQICPVLAVPMRGNHDPTSAVVLMEVFREMARHHAWLELHDTYAKRCTVVAHDTLIGLMHGDAGQGSPTSPKRLNEVSAWMAKQQRKRILASPPQLTRHMLSLQGHIHHRRHVDHAGVLHVTCRALTPPDAWHSNQGYVHAPVGLDAIVIEQGHGPTHILHYPATEAPPCR